MISRDKEGYLVLFDFSKAFDSVPRNKLFNLLIEEAKGRAEKLSTNMEILLIHALARIVLGAGQETSVLFSGLARCEMPCRLRTYG